MKQYKNDDVTKESIKGHNPHWLKIPGHPCRLLIIRGFQSRTTDSLFNRISHLPDIDNIYLYTKDPYQTKYQLLINKQNSTGLNHLIDSKAFIEYWNDMDNIYENIEEYNPNKKRKILISFDDMIADILSNKKLNTRVTNYLSEEEN